MRFLSCDGQFWREGAVHEPSSKENVGGGISPAEGGQNAGCPDAVLARTPDGFSGDLPYLDVLCFPRKVLSAFWWSGQWFTCFLMISCGKLVHGAFGKGSVKLTWCNKTTCLEEVRRRCLFHTSTCECQGFAQVPQQHWWQNRAHGWGKVKKRPFVLGWVRHTDWNRLSEGDQIWPSSKF